MIGGLAVKAAAGAVWSFLRSVPWQVWAVAALLFVGWRYGEARYDAGEADCQARHAAATAEAEQGARKEEQRQSSASAAATQAKDERLNKTLPAIEGRTNEAVERVRVIYRDRPVPAECRRPDGVREEIERARQRANSAGSELRGGPGGAHSAGAKRPSSGG